MNVLIGQNYLVLGYHGIVVGCHGLKQREDFSHLRDLLHKEIIFGTTVLLSVSNHWNGIRIGMDGMIRNSEITTVQPIAHSFEHPKSTQMFCNIQTLFGLHANYIHPYFTLQRLGRNSCHVI